MAENICLFEVGPRDGLQNEKRLIPAQDKVALVDMLTDCGFAKIEVTSFVSPKWVPQMADNSQVMAGINRKLGASYAVLTPNMKGYEGALAAGADEIAIFASATEAFCKANLNCSKAECAERFAPVIQQAHKDKMPIRGYVSVATDCPFEGAVDPQVTAECADYLLGNGCYEISLGDTIGHATPGSINAMLDAVCLRVPAQQLAGHYHDTKGRALENIQASLGYGLRTFDASVAGLGGCPYAPGSAGNVDTAKVIEMVEGLGFETGIDQAKLIEAARFARTLR